MDYYHIRTYTPFVGEEMDVYIAAATITEYQKKASDCAGENGRNYPIRIHSMNVVGAANMRRIIERNGWKEVN